MKIKEEVHEEEKATATTAAGAPPAPQPYGGQAQPPPAFQQEGQQQQYYPPPLRGYMYPPPPPPPHYAQYPGTQPQQIIVQQDPATAEALGQKTQFHQQHFDTSRNQTKTLESIASSSGFASTFGCIPIYDSKDKTACAEWLQCIKEVNFQTGHTLAQPLYTGQLKMSQMSSGPFQMMTHHMTKSLRRSCVASPTYPVQLLP